MFGCGRFLILDVWYEQVFEHAPGYINPSQHDVQTVVY